MIQSINDYTHSDLNCSGLLLFFFFLNLVEPGTSRVLATSFFINWSVDPWVLVLLFFLSYLCYVFICVIEMFYKQICFLWIFINMHYEYVHTCMVRPQELDEKDSIQNKHLSIAIMFGLLSSLVEERIAPALEYFTI